MMTASIHSLPGEIIYHIATMCPPITYYNFTLAYKRLYLVSHGYYKSLHIRTQYDIDKRYECLLNGTRHGKCTWYSGFNITEVSNFRKGFLHGVSYSYYNNGALWLSCNYIRGKYHGRYISYWQNGNVKHMTMYNMGKKYGYTLRYYENGQLECKIKHGPPVQKECYYSVEGELRHKYKFTPGGVKSLINEQPHTYE